MSARKKSILMANQQHLDMLKQGVRSWNKWRKKPPEVQPNLRKANLADLNKGMLNGVNFHRADLAGANLSKAILSSARLSYADLSEADLSGANGSVKSFV